MIFLFRLGQIFNLGKHIGINLGKAVLAVFQLPEFQLFHFLHNLFGQSIVFLFVHCAKLLSYSFSAIVKLPFHRSRGDAHPVRYLDYGKPLEIMQADYLPYFLGQF